MNTKTDIDDKKAESLEDLHDIYSDTVPEDSGEAYALSDTCYLIAQRLAGIRTQISYDMNPLVNGAIALLRSHLETIEGGFMQSHIYFRNKGDEMEETEAYEAKVQAAEDYSDMRREDVLFDGEA